MAENTNYINMFRDLGLDTRSEEQILEERRQQRMQLALAEASQTQPTFRGESDLRRSGAALGAYIANKYNKPELSPDEKLMMGAKEYADQSVKGMEESGAFGSREDGTFNALGYGEARAEKIAEYLLQNNDMRGVDLAAQVYRARQIREKDKREREKHDLDLRKGEQDLEESIYDFDRNKFLHKRGEMATIYRPGSSDPNTGIQAFIDDTGTAWTMQGGEPAPVPMNEYTLDRPILPTAKGRGGGKNPFIPPPSKQEEMRAHQRAIVQQMKLSTVMLDAMQKAIKESPSGTLDVMDGSGKLQIFSVNLVNNINAAFRQAEQWVGLTDGDPSDPNSKVTGRLDGTIANSMKYVRENQKYFDEVISIPESIEKGSIQAMRYQAAMVQLAYAKARSNEPGARQLSDHDFKMAIRQIGANATTPDGLRQVMLDNVNLADSDFEFWRKQYSPEVVNEIIPPRAMREYESTKAKWEDSFESYWGTASNPTGALVEDEDAPSYSGAGTKDDPIVIP